MKKRTLSDDQLENIKKNAKTIFKKSSSEITILNEHWYEIIIDLCNQSKKQTKKNEQLN